MPLIPVQTDAPSASVVVCAYTEKRWDQLLRGLHAARAQLRPDDQLLLVVDHNETLLERARAELAGVEILANSHERGLSGARNTALEKITGDVVVFLDDDAAPSAQWLDALRAPYADPAVWGVGGRAEPAWPDGIRPAHLPGELDWVVGCSYTGMPTEQSEVRNLMGCNMSFRREVFETVGTFDETVGRVGATPLGCEETQLCIRLYQARGDVRLLLVPDAVVDHSVSTDRLTWAYLRRRAYAEGVSKAVISRGLGSDAMSTEVDYTRRVLPAALRRDLRRLRRGERDGGRAAAAVPFALASFAGGYLSARVAQRRLDTGAAVRSVDPIHVTELDVAQLAGLGDEPLPDGHTATRILLRRGSDVLGTLDVPAADGSLAAADVRRAATGLVAPPHDAATEAATADADADARPVFGVVIATAGRAAKVERCVTSLLRGTASPAEIVIVDNAPQRTDHATALRALAERYEVVRYVAEPRPGASIARNTGVRAAVSDLLATVDDDVVVDRHWAQRLLAEFRDPGVDMVTGLVMPQVLDTSAQVYFEELGGFGKGFDRVVFDAADTGIHPLFPYAPGMVGSGNNLAFRRRAWEALGGMSTELGPGTATRSGEDLDLFLRHLLRGGRIVYTPHALVWHEHRRTEAELVDQVHGYGVGLSAVFTKLLRDDPGQLRPLARRVAPGLRRLVGSSRQKQVSAAGDRPPAAVRRAELRGFASGPRALHRARRSAIHDIEQEAA